MMKRQRAGKIGMFRVDIEYLETVDPHRLHRVVPEPERANRAEFGQLGQILHFGRPDGQIVRSTIIFLISAMAFAGLSPLGQVFVQFMMVWQR